MKKIVLSVCSCFLLAACSNPQHPTVEKTAKSPVDSLIDIVMHGHDQGMGKMGRVEKVAQELSHKIDSIKQSKKDQSTTIGFLAKRQEKPGSRGQQHEQMDEQF